MLEGLDVLEAFHEACLDRYEGKGGLPSHPEKENFDLQLLVESD
jgi:hypothetical protein